MPNYKGSIYNGSADKQRAYRERKAQREATEKRNSDALRDLAAVIRRAEQLGVFTDTDPFIDEDCGLVQSFTQALWLQIDHIEKGNQKPVIVFESLQGARFKEQHPHAFAAKAKHPTPPRKKAA